MEGNNKFGNLQVILFSFPPDRLQLFRSRSERSHDHAVEFREPIKAFEYSSTQTLICIIYDQNNSVNYLAVGRRGYGGGTGLTQIELRYVHDVAKPFQLVDIRRSLDGRSLNQAVDAFREGGLLPPKTSHAVLNSLVQWYPPAESVIDNALRRPPNPIRDLGPEKQFAFQQQKDAVMMSLQFAGMDRKEHLRSDFNLHREPTSFLEGLPQVRLREGAMLVHDFRIFPGFKKTPLKIQSAAQFTDDKTILTVMLVHEQPMEGLVGTDLIYYNETFKSFVMVQYKAMEKEGADDVFRIPDKDLNREVKKMSETLQELEKIKDEQPDVPNAFRFQTNPFFLKFCPRIIREPDNIELIPGMYLPLDYWARLSAGSHLSGKRGGKALRFDNVMRHLNNTDFAAFVRNAWMGTRIEQSVVLEKVIRETLKSGRALTFAQARQVPHEEEEEM